MARFGLALFALLAAAPVVAAERGYTITDFDRIDVSGPFVVQVETGKGPSARATGESAALDRLSVELRGRTLRIGAGVNGWGGWPGKRPAAPVIKVTVPLLREASLSGGGKLNISKMRAQSVRLGLSGSGELAVGMIETDRLAGTLLGSGTLSLSGKAQAAEITTEGSGTLRAHSLFVGALVLTSSSAGPSGITATKTAKVQSTGSGDVTIFGKPACSVTGLGAGQVICGNTR